MTAVRCTRCAAALDVCAPEIVCAGCGLRYPRLGNIPILLADPETYVESCRKQLAVLEDQAVSTVRVIEEQLRMRDVLPATKERCRATIEAVRGQAGDIRSILEPVLGGDINVPSTRAPLARDSLPGGQGGISILKYVQCLYRDWGWPPNPDGENERALAALETVLEGRPLGQMLVLGAGGCRLAYDLHVGDRTAETIVVDIDPLLFTAAHTIVRGGSITLREANAEVDEIEQVVKSWVLTAPHGAIAEDQFRFILADGREPPFEPASFDTVVTPWFIDVAPSDLRDFISTAYLLLKPGGRWLNLGPLRYRPETPVTHRFGREELFDLAARAGFRIGEWRTESMPYLVSKLNGRGKVESVLTFLATKGGAPAGGTPPAWLLFRHVAVPEFPGQSMFWTDDPATQIVVSAIDGKNTLDDIASILASQAGETGLTADQFREIVRRCLAEAHPLAHSTT